MISLGSRHFFRWGALYVLLVSFVVVQLALRGRGSMVLGRWFLVPLVLVAASHLWPVLFLHLEPTTRRIALAAALSAFTTIASLLAIPLWAGHGCWAPDLYAFIFYMFAGLALSACSVFSSRWLRRASENRRQIITAVFLWGFGLAVLLTLFGPRFSPRPAARGAERTTFEPEVAWSITPWQGLWAEIAPQPWSRAAFEPADPVVGEGVVVYIGTPGRVDILDAYTGHPRLSLPLEHRALLRGDTARFVWERPVVSTGHVILKEQGDRKIHIIDLQSGSMKTIETDDAYHVAPGGKNGFYVAGSRGLRLVSWEGETLWCSKPTFSPLKPLMEPVWFSINEFSDPLMNPWLAVSPDRVFRLEAEGLYVCDSQTGEIIWRKEPRGRFLGMTISPRRDAVYVVDVGTTPSGGSSIGGADNPVDGSAARADGDVAVKRLTAYSADGTEMWSRELPQEYFGIIWAATPEGLVLAPRLAGVAGVASAEYIGLDGSAKAHIPLPEREPYSIQFKNGLILVASRKAVFAYDAKNGRLIWEMSDLGNRPVPGGFDYWHDFVVFGDGLIVPCWSNVNAYDLGSGNLLWSYRPPGGYLSAAAGHDHLYITTRRGVFALKVKKVAD